MVNVIKVFIFSFTVLLAQDVVKDNTCNSDLIKRAKKEGMRSINVNEMPQYFMDLWNCRKEENGKKTLKRINDKTLEKDFEHSEKFTGFTATCAYCTTAIVFIFYIYKIFKFL
jgi:UTP-glucose-1-phosphate uridylyltransferase